MDDLDKEVYEKTSTNIPEEVFPGREEEEDTGTNIWRRRRRLMKNKVDEEVWSVENQFIPNDFSVVTLACEDVKARELCSMHNALKITRHFKKISFWYRNTFKRKCPTTKASVCHGLLMDDDLSRSLLLHLVLVDDEGREEEEPGIKITRRFSEEGRGCSATR